MDVSEWISNTLKAAPVREASLTAEVALATTQFSLPHRDPANMFLAATAKVFELTLVTSDKHLHSAKGISILRA